MAAQIPTGTISGRVTDSQDRSIGGATVIVTSPALQGTRTTTTAPNGDFVIPLLPPGLYTVLIESPGFAPVAQTRQVAATATIHVNITLQPAALSEDITVQGDTTAFTNTVQSASNFNQLVLSQLPSSRTLRSAVVMAPTVHESGPNNNISIAGAMSFENLFMLNGVRIQDNIRGTPYDLFIEDAIQETTVATSGVSAEYGRFTGGVVNAITKSGGNTFSGSFRTSFRNDNWRRVSPYGESKVDQVIPTYEYTIGGPIVRDRTWFFLAGRLEDSNVSRETAYTDIPYELGSNEKRFEFKGTQAITSDHRLQVAYTRGALEQTNYAAGTVMDLASLVDRRTPQTLLAVHYTGSLRPNFYLEGQYSARSFTFEGSGGRDRDLIRGTTLMDQTTGARWWSPTFCGVCTDEVRSNDAFVLKGNYFLTTTNAGSHQMVFGYDRFNDKLLSDNHQSASDWHIWTTGSVIDDGTVYPVIRPGASTWIINWPILESSKGTNFVSHAVFVNDTWTLNRHVTFNLGLRYDKNAGRDASGSLVADDSILAPRLGVVWDPTGSGVTSVNASYGRYGAGLNNSIAGSGSAAGTPAILGYLYQGAPINTGGAPYVPTDVAIRQVFDWYDASGGATLFAADIPGLATKIGGSLKSPYADEVVVGVSHQLGRRAAVRLDFIDRKFGNFYTSRRDMTTGQVEDEYGQRFDVALIENTNNLKRQYRGLSAQASYRASTRLHSGISYTLSRTWGNINGETTGSGPVTSSTMEYPEYFDMRWFAPEGDLEADQRHRARIWATYTLPWTERFATVNVGLVQILESGTPYGAVGSVETAPYVDDPGYAVPPGPQTYYFTSRDAFRTEGQKRTDLSLNLSRRLGASASVSAPELFAQFQLQNVFNQFQAFNVLATSTINTTVLSAVDTPTLQEFNPFTETPIEGVHWRKGDQFGKPIGRAAYTTPRTFRFSVGLRF
ncbi:MAG: hypothetical protein ABS36_19360 [Acidobacteria bacterium SCN 69-37]|nr:MAG: hypothetical protein ABS36_19360 [Acidobacteria bacterium SCN 69-37]